MVTVKVLVGGDEVLVCAPSLDLAATVGEIIFPIDPEEFFSEDRETDMVLLLGVVA